MAFFTFNQNNTGGTFTRTEGGLSTYVIIEAADADEANARAEALGIYFNGVDEGRDCKCCGDRWDPASGQGAELPTVYGTPVVNGEIVAHIQWAKDGSPEGYLHYRNGQVVPLIFRAHDQSMDHK